MTDKDGVLGGDGVEIGPGGMALLLHGKVVVVVPENPFPGLDLGGAGLEQGLEVGDAFHLAERRHVEVDHVQLAIGPVREMAVPVHHAGNQRLALEIDHMRLFPGGGEHVGLLAHGENRIAPNGDGFHDVVVLVHREDRAAGVYGGGFLGVGAKDGGSGEESRCGCCGLQEASSADHGAPRFWMFT